MGTNASRLADFLGRPLLGPDIIVNGPCSYQTPQTGCLIFLKEYDPALIQRYNEIIGMLVLAPPSYGRELHCSLILTDSPRLDFAKLLREFFMPPQQIRISDTAVIAESAQIGVGVSIGDYCVIGNNVHIGDNTVIRHHVVIHDGTVIGKNCLIKSNTVIGEEGFGFEFEDEVAIRIPHFGRVVIGNNVEIGALNSIARATLGETLLADGVKTDDHVFIAHNVSIGENSFIIAGAEISGSVHVGKNVWIAPQAAVINQVTIGDDAMIGIGAIVTKAVDNNMIVAGNPAKVLRKRFPEK